MSDPPESVPVNGLIDLHSHTNESDGSLTPAELVALAQQVGADTIAITDHDTFRGYEAAVPFAREAGVDLIRGIELNSRLKLADNREHRSVHLLGYFPSDEPSTQFNDWLRGARDERVNRNRRLADALQRRGVDITVEEVEAQGRSLAGRVHFARILVQKGYAKNSEDAFRKYLDESAPSYVHRESQTTQEAIGIIRAGGGIPVLAHPVRLSLPRDVERNAIEELKQAGLVGLEVYHSEHPPALQAHYRQLAEELDLLPTGGSDFHGAPKPGIELGTGLNGNLRVPREFLDRLRAFRA